MNDIAESHHDAPSPHVGPGAVGEEIYTMLTAAGMTVLPVGRHAVTADSHFAKIYAASEVTQLLPDADAVVLSLPLTSATRGFMSKDLIAKMNPAAAFINVGRGGLVDEPALIEALRARGITMAALDVFMQEPLPKGHVLWKMDNVLVSPHISGDTVGFEELTAAQFIENLSRWSEERAVQYVVDKQKLSASARNSAQPFYFMKWSLVTMSWNLRRMFALLET